MFGHDDDNTKTDDAAATDTSGPVVTPTEGAPAVDVSADLSAPTPAADPAPSEETPLITSTGTPDPAPSEPAAGDVTSTDTTSGDVDTSGADETAPVFSDTEATVPEVTPEETPEEAPAVEVAEPTPTDTSSTDDAELLSLKKEAIDELAPLLDQLEQSPEEKFKTTMMMIQATDSSSLVKVAHAAAKEISDEKVRAQALLDIVNEINYFTHPDAGDKN
jgi:hypothetical protein